MYFSKPLSETFRKHFFLILFIFSGIIFLTHTYFTKTAIFADGRFYYAITRSLVKDHDIIFVNEYRNLGIGINYTNKDYVWNMYPPGVSLFWIPLFTLANGMSQLLNLIPGINIDTAGYGFIYQSAAAFTGIFLGISGLYLLYVLLSNYFPDRISLLTIITFFGATNLLFYIAVEPINSHAASFFISSLFVYYFLLHKKDKYYYFVLGVLGGIVGLVRTLDTAILILPIIQIIFQRKNIKSSSAHNLLLTAGFLIGFLPQIIFWKKIFNTFWYSPYIEVGFNFLQPKLWYILFNSQNGLLTITPIIGVAFLGLFYPKKKIKYIFWYAFFYFLLQLYLVSSWNSSLGGSFSNRMMLTTYPLLVFGLAAITEKFIEQFGQGKTELLISGFSLLNMFMLLRYLLSY